MSGGVIEITGPTVVWVENLSEDAAVALVGRGEMLRVQNLPQEKGLGGFFYLSGDVGESYKVLIKRNFVSDLPITAQIRVDPEIAEGRKKALKAIDNSLTSWSANNLEDWKRGEIELGDALEMLGAGLTEYTDIFVTYLWMLLNLEKFEDVISAVLADRILFAESGSEKALFEVELVYTIALWNSGNLELAEAVARRLVAKFDNESDLSKSEQLIRELARNELGSVLMMAGAFRAKPQKMEEAKLVLNHALKTSREAGDSRMHAMLLNHISPYYFENDKYSEAEKIIRDSIELHEIAGSKRLLSDALNNLARLYQSNEQIEQAILSLYRALEIERKLFAGTDTATLQMHLGRLLIDIGDAKSAELYYSESEIEFREGGNEFYSTISLKGLGKAKRMQGFWQAAAIDFEAAYEYFYTNGYEKYAFSTAIELLDLMNFTNEENSQIIFGVTRETLMDQIDNFENGAPKSSKEKIEKWLYLLKVALSQRDNDSFIEYERKINALFDLEQKERWREEKLRLIKIVMRRAISLSDYEAVEQWAQKAYKIVDQVRFSLGFSFLSPKWTHKIGGIVDLHLISLLQQWDSTGNQIHLEEMFQVTENYQSPSSRIIGNKDERGLLAELSDDSNSNASRKTYELNAISAKHVKERNSARRYFLQQKLGGTWTKIKKQSNSGSETLPSSFKKFQELIPANHLVLRFYVRDRISFVLRMGRDKLDLQKLPLKPVLEDVLFRSAKSLRTKSANILTNLKKASSVLKLELGDHLSKTKVVYVPDGPINVFPLGLLHSSEPFDERTKLFEAKELVRTLSISDYYSTIKNKSVDLNRPDIAIFSNPDFDPSSLAGNDSVMLAGQQEGLRSWFAQLPRLPGTRREAEHIKTLFRGKYVLELSGANATNSSFLAQNFRTSKIIHIGTHGYYDEQTPNIVGIATSIDPKVSTDNGFLSLTDIQDYHFFSNLAVLSGCETGLGENLDGEGLVGLTYGMLSSGVGSVLSTLWSIPDASTAMFMKKFYQNLIREQGNASLALSKTKVFMSKSALVRHPFYWAGFVLTSTSKGFEEDVFN